jgi:hypothetical protein
MILSSAKLFHDYPESDYESTEVDLCEPQLQHTEQFEEANA